MKVGQYALDNQHRRVQDSVVCCISVAYDESLLEYLVWKRRAEDDFSLTFTDYFYFCGLIKKGEIFRECFNTLNKEQFFVSIWFFTFFIISIYSGYYTSSSNLKLKNKSTKPSENIGRYLIIFSCFYPDRTLFILCGESSSIKNYLSSLAKILPVIIMS